MSTFPQPFISTTSHWQATNRGPTSLYGHGADAALPDAADIVIVGGGTMGASLAYFLTRKGAEGAGKRVVLVEAKDVASGASGRNGGHLGPATFEWYYHLLQPLPHGAGLTPKEAVHVIQAERDNLELICHIIKKENLDADLWKGDLVEIHETKEDAVLAKAQYKGWLEAREKYGYTSCHDTQLITDKMEAERISRFNNVESVQLRPAGSVHSHKLCTSLMRTALSSPHSDFQLFTWTPVDSITPPCSHLLRAKESRWTVKTGKGSIKADRVVLCTNAHTQNFFPKDHPMHSHIQPRFRQCALVTPPETYSGSKSLQNTYNMPEEWYLIQTPMGGIVIGGGTEEMERRGALAKLGNEDDSFVVDEWTKIIANYCPTHFKGWGKEGYGEGLTRIWSGILSAVKDFLPVVGEIPAQKGLFIAAGFHGHGQSRIFSVAQALAKQLQTGHWDEALLPRSFELTQARLDRVAGVEKDLQAQGVNWFDPGKTHFARTNAIPMEGSETFKVEIDNHAVSKEAEGVLAKGEEQERAKGWGCVVC